MTLNNEFLRCEKS